MRPHIVDAAQIDEWDDTATDEELSEERRHIQQAKQQLHWRDQQIVAILTERGRRRRGVA